MKKLIGYTIIIFMVFAACENAQKPSENKTSEAPEAAEIVELGVDNFKTMAGDLVGKKVTISGLIDHVCKHGGRKMFLVHEQLEGRVKVVPNEDMASFTPEMEGSVVWVKGTIDEEIVDEAYLIEWEDELKSEYGDFRHPDAEPHAEGEHDEYAEGMKKIENFRKQIEESGKDHLSFYSIIAEEYKLQQETRPSEEGYQ